MEKKVKVIVAAAVAVVVVAAIAIFFALKGGGKSLDEYLDLGAKYLEEQDYDKAIEAYTEALKIDDMSVEAYLGLADAYVGKGDIEKAKEVLQTGYDKTGDERLLDKLNNLGSGAGNGDLVEVPLTDAGKKLVEYAAKADTITYNGSTLTAQQMSSMSTEDVAATFGLTVPEYGDSNMYIDENNYESDFMLFKTNGALIATNGGITQVNFNFADNAYPEEHYLIYSQGGGSLPDYVGAKDLVDLLNANNVTTVEDIIKMATGQEVGEDTLMLIQDGKCLVGSNNGAGTLININYDSFVFLTSSPTDNFDGMTFLFSYN